MKLKTDNYHDQINAQNTLKLREVLKDLPLFVATYLNGLGDYMASRTRLGYAYDLKIFFGFLTEEIFFGKTIRDITISELATVESEHIEAFMAYLSYYIPVGEPAEASQGEAKRNAALGKSRKLAAVRRLFKHLYMRKHIPANPAELVAFPKIHGKVITTLEPDEIVRLLDEVDKGEKLNARQKQFHERTRFRDAAIITLLLGTGLRVSECVGLDLHHVDFTTGGLRVIRKGGDEAILYFGVEVESALINYLEVREKAVTQEGHENALFLSLQNRRLTDRAIQKMVKKYASLITQLKDISPHKLRSTFGTQLYAETRDIYLVADVLGHADVNTTRKHYAKMDDSSRRRAANAVRLRE